MFQHTPVVRIEAIVYHVSICLQNIPISVKYRIGIQRFVQDVHVELLEVLDVMLLLSEYRIFSNSLRLYFSRKRRS